MPKSFSGGCFCRAVRYRLLDTPMFVHCCHCTECQNQTGTAFVVNAIIETAKLEKIRGTLEKVAMSKKGEPPHDIYRCKKCKVAVWSDYGHRPGIRFVRVGTFDRPGLIKPDVHIFTRSKVPWVRLPKDARAFKIYYEMQKLWPKKSLTRRQKAIAQTNP